MCGGMLQMRWLLRRLGNQQPHARQVITPAHEGPVSSVWQSSHNSGLIHHMGIMPLTGTAPKKSYTRSSPVLESLNNPIPLLSTQSFGWKERGQMGRSYWLKEKNIYFGPCPPANTAHLCLVKKGCVLVIHAFSFARQIPWHPPLIALITGICQDSYQLGFSCLCFNMSNDLH